MQKDRKQYYAAISQSADRLKNLAIIMEKAAMQIEADINTLASYHLPTERLHHAAEAAQNIRTGLLQEVALLAQKRKFPPQ